MRICIIGGGIVGLAVARTLHESHPDSKIVLLEKELNYGSHQSTHNSGVLHAGLYYKPGSLKSRLSVEGIRKMVDFCIHNSIKHEICGKLVVATNESEVVRLRSLHQRGIENGLLGLAWLGVSEMKEREPFVGGIAALSVPEEGIVDYRGVCNALELENRLLGTELYSGVKVTQCRRKFNQWVISASNFEGSADYIVNCAGLHSDRVAQLLGEDREVRIVPFRGEYYELKSSAKHLVRNLIYPVPDPTFPFLGVHFTRLVNGSIEAGPNAVLALAREGYSKWNINPSEAFDSLSFKGLWKFLAKHKDMVLSEMIRSVSRKAFSKSLQRLIPAIKEQDLAIGGSGVRAQAMDTSGHLIQDFAFIERSYALHLINAPSPAATASIAIADEIVKRIPSL
jgi:(S)-2-hydroxyglutarate dehydrogenase